MKGRLKRLRGQTDKQRHQSVKWKKLIAAKKKRGRW